MKNKFASPIIGSILIVPSIDEGLPLVTRARMFWTVFGPVKVADCELFKLNWLKLWKRLVFSSFPTLAGIKKLLGPDMGNVVFQKLPSSTTPPNSG